MTRVMWSGMMVELCRSIVMRWVWGWKWGHFEPGGVGKYEMGWKCGVFQPIFMDDTPERVGGNASVGVMPVCG